MFAEKTCGAMDLRYNRDALGGGLYWGLANVPIEHHPLLGIEYPTDI